MILPVLLGMMWGFLASGVHFLLLRRTIATRLEGGKTPSLMAAQASSLWRMLVVGGLLVVGLIRGVIRLDVALVAYAISFLGMIVVYGIRLSLETARTEALHKESGR